MVRQRSWFCQASLLKAEENPDSCNLDSNQILELYEKGPMQRMT